MKEASAHYARGPVREVVTVDLRDVSDARKLGVVALPRGPGRALTGTPVPLAVQSRARVLRYRSRRASEPGT